MICRRYKAAICMHDAEPPGYIQVVQGGRRRSYVACGRCLESIEAELGRRPEPARQPLLEPSPSR